MASSLLKRKRWTQLLKSSSSSSMHQQQRAFRFPTYEVTLMNHGESEDDAAQHYGGWQDSKLTAHGLEQARRAGRIICDDDAHFHVAYTSELRRAQDTVKQALEPLQEQPKVFTTWRLNDRHFGDLTGYNRSQMALVHGERKLREWIEDYSSMPPIIKVENPKYRAILDNMTKKHLSVEQVPRTESLQMVYNRVLPYWEAIIVPCLKMRNKVIVIAHNDSLCAIIKRFAELTDEEAMQVTLPPAIPFTFTLDNHMKIIQGKVAKAYVAAGRQQQEGGKEDLSMDHQLAVAQHHLHLPAKSHRH